MAILELDLIDETEKLSNDASLLVADILEFAASYLKLDEGTEMSVTFMDNSGIQEINREYRGKDAPTDVISFALEEQGEDEMPIIFEEDMMPRNLGDIIISTERAAEQAEEYGHSFDRELGFLAVHGLLHLLGYDHMEKEEEKEMFGLQKEVLDAYGLKR
ncbi:metal-binding heat shock protein [Listeria floridensis FSL S10-1187]|uniref:Endoribonuclease YbeY n=1 Tax=Listeria floridensis FSL S10-1187 TaxID=1265817 RepID=A0ABN0RHG0_9LIST|nr:rRNA maturation RNase YbeY [Listeria floridensis]EUJ33351.1 metal-binding heat shock protein [Listeria floridensis FSL S10-1187]